jgi:hypothetical protein
MKNHLVQVSVLAVCVCCVPAATANHAWINEFHYDNEGGDVNEFVEVVVRATPGGQDPAELQLDLYNGNSGDSYSSTTLDGANVTVTSGPGFAYYVWDVPGIQNGAPDGIALSVAGSIVQFFSYEGQFTATDGPANGITSLDIGVSESTSTPIGSALALTGSGEAAIDFVWSGPQSATPGAANINQFLVPEPCAGRLLLLGLALTFARRGRRRQL